VTSDPRSRAAALRQRGGQGEALTRRLSSLIKISQALAGPGTLDELVESVAREVCAHLMADQVFFLLQDARGELHVRAEHPRNGTYTQTSVSGSVCDEAMRGAALFIPEALNDPRFQGQASVLQLNLRSVLVAPVTPVGSGVPTGLLYACTYSPDGQVFGEEDLELLKALASQVSIHLDRARVLAEKDRLLGELGRWRPAGGGWSRWPPTSWGRRSSTSGWRSTWLRSTPSGSWPARSPRTWPSSPQPSGGPSTACTAFDRVSSTLSGPTTSWSCCLAGWRRCPSPSATWT